MVIEPNLLSQNKKIALCGMLCAFSLVIMLTSHLGVTTYASPAVAGVILIAAVREAGFKWAAAAYFATGLLSYFMSPPDACLLYIFLFGYYPFIKSKLDYIKPKFFSYIIKFAIFNTAVIAAFFIMSRLFGIPVESLKIGDFESTPAMLLLGNIVFLLYDRGLRNLIMVYEYRLHPKIRKILKG